MLFSPKAHAEVAPSPQGTPTAAPDTSPKQPPPPEASIPPSAPVSPAAPRPKPGNKQTQSASAAPPNPSLSPAAEQAEPERAPAPTEAAAPRGPVYVDVTLDGFELDPLLVRVAVAKELGVAVSNSPTPTGAVVKIIATKGGDMVVSFSGPPNGASDAGGELVRAVKAPERDDEVPELAALLVGNLARDEAAPLLNQLNPPAAPEPKPKPESPSKPEPEKPKPAQSIAAPRPELAHGTFNLSLMHPITLVPETEKKTFNGELGLVYSRLGGLSGFAATVGLLRIDQGADGAQFGYIGILNEGPVTGARFAGLFSAAQGSLRGVSLSGIVDLNAGDIAGAQFGGLASLNQGKMDGAQVAGAVSINQGPLRFTQLAGLASLNHGSLDGAQIAGAVSINQGPLRFAQLAGLASLNSERLDGFQAAGAVSANGGSVQGAQLSGLASIAGDDLTGAQISAGVNIADQVNGAQIGLVNIGGQVRGLQLGLVNVAQDVKGASVGLVTYSRSGKTQAVAWYSNTRPLNAGVRFYTGPLYAMPTIGMDPSDTKKFFPGFSLGARIPVQRAFVDIDANYSAPVDAGSYDEHTVDLRYRVLAGFQITDWLGVFAGGGVRHYFRTQGASAEKIEPEVSAGVQVF